jgi:hypothetical protein
VPINGIIATALVIFIFQAVMSMYYNNNALMFPDIEAFNSINKAAAAADFDFIKVFKDLPSKKWSDGFLYQLCLSPFCRLAGKSNTISAVFILDLIMFAALLLIFYRVALDYLGGELSFISMLLFAISPPVMLAAFSGAETALTMLLFAAAFYHAYFSLPRKKYAGLLVFSILMLFNGWIPAAFGLAFLIYAVLCAGEKKNRKHMPAIFIWAIGVYAVAVSAIFIYVFMHNLSIDYLRNNGLLDVKTWTVDSLFKDGFLWSKSAPMFFTVFFYIAFFTGISGELKEKTAGIFKLTAFLAAAAFLAGFFSCFEPVSRTYLFVSPFYFCLYLCAMKGLDDFSGYMEMKKNPYFTARNLLYGFVMFFILYSVIMSFNRTVEADNYIQYMTGDGSVSKYLER